MLRGPHSSVSFPFSEGGVLWESTSRMLKALSPSRTVDSVRFQLSPQTGNPNICRSVTVKDRNGDQRLQFQSAWDQSLSITKHANGSTTEVFSGSEGSDQ